MTDIRSLTGKIWHVRGQRAPHESLFDAFCRVRSLPPRFMQVSKLEDLTPSHLLPGIPEATEVILAAIKNSRSLLLFGDYDLDGMSGTALLTLALRTLGAKVSARLPGRSDGYGLTRQVYDDAKAQAIDLIVTIDCGSANGEYIEYGKTLGIETIITDHHSIPPIPPKPRVFVHPHLGANDSEYYEITGAGVAFFLAKSLLQTAHPKSNLRPLLNKLAELAILGTVADVGKLVGQNRVLLQIGLESIRKTKHPGLLALFRSANIDPAEITAETIAFYLAPRLNAAGRVAHPEWSLQILLGDPRYAEEYSNQLETFHAIRREQTDALLELAEKMIMAKQSESESCFVLYHPQFSSGIAGLVAARIAEKYSAPAIVLSPATAPDMLTASCRGPEDFHFAEALHDVAPLLQKYGGHRCAAGFSIAAEKLADFRVAFGEVVRTRRGITPPAPELFADLSTEVNELLSNNFDELLQAAPFGAGNPEPLFLLRDIVFPEIRNIGKDQSHLAGSVGNLSQSVPFIAFRFAELLPETRQKGRFDVLVHAEMRSYRGRKSLQLKIADLRESQTNLME